MVCSPHLPVMYGIATSSAYVAPALPIAGAYAAATVPEYETQVFYNDLTKQDAIQPLYAPQTQAMYGTNQNENDLYAVMPEMSYFDTMSVEQPNSKFALGIPDQVQLAYDPAPIQEMLMPMLTYLPSQAPLYIPKSPGVIKLPIHIDLDTKVQDQKREPDSQRNTQDAITTLSQKIKLNLTQLIQEELADLTHHQTQTQPMLLYN